MLSFCHAQIVLCPPFFDLSQAEQDPDQEGLDTQKRTPPLEVDIDEHRFSGSLLISALFRAMGAPCAYVS